MHSISATVSTWSFSAPFVLILSSVCHAVSNDIPRTGEHTASEGQEPAIALVNTTGTAAALSIPLDPAGDPDAEFEQYDEDGPSMYAPQLCHIYLTALQQLWLGGVYIIEKRDIQDPTYPDYYIHLTASHDEGQIFDSRQAMWAVLGALEETFQVSESLDAFFWTTNDWLFYVHNRQSPMALVEIDTLPELSPGSVPNFAAGSPGPEDVPREDFLSGPGFEASGSVVSKRKFRRRQVGRHARAKGHDIIFEKSASPGWILFNRHALISGLLKMMYRFFNQLADQDTAPIWIPNTIYAYKIPSPEPRESLGVEMQFWFFPPRPDQPVTVKEAVECSLDILARLGQNASRKEAFTRDWTAICKRKGESQVRVMTVKAKSI